MRVAEALQQFHLLVATTTILRICFNLRLMLQRELELELG